MFEEIYFRFVSPNLFLFQKKFNFLTKLVVLENKIRNNDNHYYLYLYKYMLLHIQMFIFTTQKLFINLIFDIDRRVFDTLSYELNTAIRQHLSIIDIFARLINRLSYRMNVKADA